MNVFHDHQLLKECGDWTRSSAKQCHRTQQYKKRKREREGGKKTIWNSTQRCREYLSLIKERVHEHTHKNTRFDAVEKKRNRLNMYCILKRRVRNEALSKTFSARNWLKMNCHDDILDSPIIDWLLCWILRLIIDWMNLNRKESHKRPWR